jgi:hypothetical protein
MRSDLVRSTPAAALFLALFSAACTDQGTPLAPTPPPVSGTPGTPVTVQVVDCHGDRQSLTVTCAPPSSGAAGSGADIIVGGQHLYVNVMTTGVGYNAGTGEFTFNTRLQSLIEQEMGTTDGVSLDPNGIRIFFHQLPAVVTGSGAIAVVGDGTATFTAAGQPFYQYNEIVDHNEISASKVWTLTMPTTVTTFDFKLYVSAPVPHPNGYITLNGQLPGYYVGSMHPGDALGMAAVSKNAVGEVVPGTTITFSSGDPLCASVSAGGLITAIRAQNCDIYAADGTRSGYVNVTVTGTVRTWDGSASTDWSNGANWVGDLTPADVDSVHITTGVPNQPALVANTLIGGVEVDDVATLSLGAFNLSASANVATGATVGSGVLATTGQLLLVGTGTVHGRLPSTLVTGTYALDGDVNAVAAQQVESGQLTSENFALIAVSQ